MKIVKLFPAEDSKYHFGDHMLESTSLIFHSDSLFSAIINNYRKLYPINVKEDVEHLKNIKISSVFPAYDDVLFIPRPITKLNFGKKMENYMEKKSKDIKNIEFISLKALRDHNNGTLDFNIETVIDKKFLISKDEDKRENIFFEITEEKVGINRTNNKASEGNLFVISYVKPQDNTYFYFFLDEKVENDIKKKLYASIRLIADEGLGGERTSGAGLFDEIKIEDYNGFENYYIDSNYNMSLSLVFPKDKTEFECAETYQLVERKGFIYFAKGSGSRKKGILMIKEGSIFKENIEGKVIDVSPNDEYTICKFGRFFGIPIKYIENDPK
ncbi:MAG: type III-A CRISPR-associated RAMP protein Csm4 [Candidatus Altiarchaeota archaeon]